MSVKKTKQRMKRTSGKASSGSDRRQNRVGEALRFSGSTKGRPAMLLLRFELLLGPAMMAVGRRWGVEELPSWVPGARKSRGRRGKH